MTTFYTYAHLKPDSTPFYIGKGTLSRAKNLTKGRNAWHQRVVSKYGVENIIIEMVQCSSEDEAFFREKLAIASLRSAGVALCNLTDGGEGIYGFKHSEESREKMRRNHKHTPASDYAKARASEVHSGKVVTPETREKMSKASKEKMKDPAFKENLRQRSLGIKRSPEVRAKYSAAQKARVISEGEREAMRARATGRVQSEATRRKRSESLKGRPRPDDVKAKIAATLTGRKRPPEYCAKMSAIMQARKSPVDDGIKTEPSKSTQD